MQRWHNLLLLMKYWVRSRTAARRLEAGLLSAMEGRTPVLLFTDIGADIDDTMYDSTSNQHFILKYLTHHSIPASSY